MRSLLGLLVAAAAAVPTAIAAAAGTAPVAGPGERAFQKCYSCHSIEAGRNDLEGPTLHAVVGRRIASEAGFEDYSPALRRLANEEKAWTAELLDRFIADPESVAPGTTMAFAGMRDPSERAALIDYLRRSSARTTNSDSNGSK